MAAEAQPERVLAGECISRAQIDAAGTPDVDAIRAAIDALDYERAAMLVLARAKRGAPLATDVIASVLPGIELPAITCALVAIAPDRAALLDVVERKLYPQTKDASELEAIVLYGAWRAGADLARVIPQLRRLSVRSMTAEGFALLATMAQDIDDPNVAAATKHIASFAKEYAKQVAGDERAMTAKLDDVIAALPAEVETSRAAGFTVRGAKQVGRNDPCPCGSGLKYKKCCADKPEATPSPIAGVSWDEFLRGDKLTEQHVDELALRDLARVELARLGDGPLFAAAHRFSSLREWAHAERAVDEIARRGNKDKEDDARDWLIQVALDCGDIARVRAHVAKLSPEIAKHYDLDLAIADGPAAAWQTLARVAREAVASSDKIPDIDLAYALLRNEPALGIIAARACIGTLQVDDPDMLLETVEDARDQLNLPPSDPAWDVLDELTVKDKKEGDDADKLRTSLHESSVRIDQLERTLSAVRGELADARTRPAAELSRAPEARPSGLEAKVRELELLIREGQEERRDLRKQLQATADRPRADDGHRARRADAGEDDDVGDALPPGTRGIAIPRFDRRVVDALAEVPAAVASEAMRTIGTLAAGDGFAWRGVKQAKDMTRQVLMARVGIHHRLLFRVEDGALDALDLITREQLMTTLKRLRGAR